MRSAPRAEGAISPKHAGTERASRRGVSLAWSGTNSEGPRRGTSLLGRTRRRVGGLGSRPGLSDRFEPAGQKESLHAVEYENRTSRHAEEEEPGHAKSHENAGIGTETQNEVRIQIPEAP